MKHRNFVFLETIIIPWIWFDFGDFGENYKWEKEEFQTWEHVTFALIMIDYLISNADDGPWITDPVIKITSVIYRSEMTLEKLHVWIQICEISTFWNIHIWFRNWTFGDRSKCPLKRSVDQGPWPRGPLWGPLSHQIASSSKSILDGQ